MTSTEGIFIYIREGKLERPNFVLAWGYEDNKFFISRNDYRIDYPIEGLDKCDNEIALVIGIEPTSLFMFILDKDFREKIEAGGDLFQELLDRKKEVITPPTYPTHNLIKWAKERNIIQQHFYDSHEDFFEVVIDSLQSIQTKVEELGVVNPFWNIVYQGNKIEKRTPKTETDVLPTLNALLYDIALAKNYEIYPEHQIASGNLDFYLRGTLKTGKKVDVCVEFKNAHSQRLLQGALKQLPAYMKAKNCKYGIYCVLFYKGKYFNEPKEYDFHKIEIVLNNALYMNGLSNVRLIMFTFSQPISPSKLK